MLMFQIWKIFCIKIQNFVNPNVAFGKKILKKRLITEKIFYFTASYTILPQNFLQILRFSVYFITKNFAFRVEIAQSSVLFSWFISCDCMVNRFKSSIRWLQSHCFPVLVDTWGKFVFRICSEIVSTVLASCFSPFCSLAGKNTFIWSFLEQSQKERICIHFDLFEFVEFAKIIAKVKIQLNVAYCSINNPS